MDKMTLFSAMATGRRLKVVDTSGRWAIGIIARIELESGPMDDKEPNMFLVTVATDDDDNPDVVTLFVRTVN